MLSGTTLPSFMPPGLFSITCFTSDRKNPQRAECREMGQDLQKVRTSPSEYTMASV